MMKRYILNGRTYLFEEGKQPAGAVEKKPARKARKTSNKAKTASNKAKATETKEA